MKHANPRRRHIVEAALRVIAERGVDAATHRAVAAEAGVALGSTTYYFDSREALVAEALALVVDRSVAHVRAFAAGDEHLSADELVDRVVGLGEAQATDETAPLAAQYELLLEAGRRTALTPIAEHWELEYSAALVDLAERTRLPDPGEAAEVLSCVVEGVLLDVVGHGGRPALVRLRPLVERTVRGLALA